MIKDSIEQALSGIVSELGVPEVSFLVEHPKDLTHGDYATNIALVTAKILGKNPKEVAELVKEKLLAVKLPEIEKVEVAGAGFVNITLSKKFFAGSVAGILNDKEFGKTGRFAGQTWAVEYASPNPNKAMHLGHLRNVLTGISICNVLEANGARVIREMVDNNRGIAIAKLMWGFLVGAKKDGSRIEDVAYWAEHEDEWLTPEEVDKPADQFVDEWYVQGAQECENATVEEKVRELVVAWEAKDKTVWKLWQKVLSYSYEGQKKTLARLGARFDTVWHEHEHYEEGKQYVEQGLANGIFKKLPDGAVLTNLESYDIPDTILIKRDGTSLYITQDIALTALKKKTHKADKLLWIIGPEQSLAMKQLFAVCEQLRIGARTDFEHVPYGYMSIKGQGKMSSRKGNVVYIDTLLDEAKAEVQEVMRERVPVENLDVLSETIAHAAVVFGILKAGRTTDTAFDFTTALRLEGDTGPYVQYAAVRAHAVLEKAREAGLQVNAAASDAWQTTTLERLLCRFPEVVADAATELAPNAIAEYLLTLASAFNSFYGNMQIIESDGTDTGYKLALTKAFAKVVKSGLALLGTTVPEKM